MARQRIHCRICNTDTAKKVLSLTMTQNTGEVPQEVFRRTVYRAPEGHFFLLKGDSDIVLLDDVGMKAWLDEMSCDKTVQALLRGLTGQ